MGEMNPTHVVVDGSNLATEGRTLPSLSQLEEAIEAYQEEHPELEVIVVVDATFEHRVDASEREKVKEAELHGEIVSPPAGAIGRGDAFVLKIAKRTGAVVLSNDSFQEFHGEHPWLFDEGRLIGGKPVTGVGWIFTPRTPVRGPKSRAATQAASRKAPVGARKKLAVTRPDGSKPKVGDVLTPAAPPERKKIRAYELAAELGVANKDLLALAKKAKVALKSHSSSIEPDDADKVRDFAKQAEASKKIRAYELARELGIDNKALLALAKLAKVDVASHASSILETDAAKIRKTSVAAERAATVVAEAAAGVDEEVDAQASGTRRRRRRRRGGTSPEAEQAVEQPSAAEEKNAAGAKKTPKAKKAGEAEKAAVRAKTGRTRSSNKPDAPQPINEPLDLVNFLASFEVGSEVDGTVTSFTSHGAMADVALGGDRTFRCYAPTVRLGNPAPAKARDVLTRGESYRFRVVSIDAPRRVAEIELV